MVRHLRVHCRRRPSHRRPATSTPPTTSGRAVTPASGGVGFRASSRSRRRPPGRTRLSDTPGRWTPSVTQRGQDGSGVPRYHGGTFDISPAARRGPHALLSGQGPCRVLLTAPDLHVQSAGRIRTGGRVDVRRGQRRRGGHQWARQHGHPGRRRHPRTGRAGVGTALSLAVAAPPASTAGPVMTPHPDTGQISRADRHQLHGHGLGEADCHDPGTR